MIAGCIDIGSNTTRLLVAERDSQTGALRAVHKERVFLPLTGVEDGDPVALRRLGTLEVIVSRLAGDARACGVAPGQLRAVATQALRSVPEPERGEVLRRLSDAAGVAVELLSPDQEAQLAFAGATACVDRRCSSVGVIDVGGGSTELIIGAPGQVPTWWCSIPLGSRVLTERFLHTDPPTEAELRGAETAARTALADGSPPEMPLRVWTVGGGTQSLATLLGGRPADSSTLADTIATLTAAPAIEVAAAHGLDELRTRMLPAALVLLRAAVDLLGRPAEPGAGGAREGIVIEIATSGHSAD